jgi:hypothetical protein
MTRKEFTSKTDILRRIKGRYMFVLQALAFSWLFGAVACALYLQRHFSRQQWDSIVDGWVPGVFAAIAFPGFIGIVFIGQYLARKWGLICCNCRKMLVEKDGRKAQLTGECPKCRAKIFDESPTVNSAIAKTLDLEDFKTKLKDLTRRQLWRFLVWPGVLLSASTIGSVMFRHLLDSVNQGKLNWMTERWRGITTIIAGGIFLSWSSLFLFLALGKLEPRELPCPGCGHSLLGRLGTIALESGVCIYCGCRPFGKMPLENLSLLTSAATGMETARGDARPADHSGSVK